MYENAVGVVVRPGGYLSFRSVEYEDSPADTGRRIGIRGALPRCLICFELIVYEGACWDSPWETPLAPPGGAELPADQIALRSGGKLCRWSPGVEEEALPLANTRAVFRRHPAGTGLCDILLDHRRVDQERLADLYLGLTTPKGSFVGAHRGIGRRFRQVLAALERGVPRHWPASQPPESVRRCGSHRCRSTSATSWADVRLGAWRRA